MSQDNLYALWTEADPPGSTAATLRGPCAAEAEMLIGAGFDVPAVPVLAVCAERFAAITAAGYRTISGRQGEQIATEMRFFAAHWRGLAAAIDLSWSTAWRQHAARMAPLLEIAREAERAHADPAAHDAWVARIQHDWVVWFGSNR
jgi:hypothetical protein